MYKFIFFALFIAVDGYCKDIKLHLSKVGPNSEIGLEEIFQLKAVVSSSNETSDVEVDGLDPFNVVGKSTARNISIINGQMKSETTFVYNLKSDQEGEFNIGPAYIKDKSFKDKSFNGNLKSNIVKVRVKTSPAVNDRSRSAFLKMMVDKNEAVIGESILLRIKFYFGQRIQDDIRMTIPESSGFTFKELNSIRANNEYISGQEFSVLEKQMLVTPIKTGGNKIPPVKAIYTEVIQDRPDEFVFGAQVFGFFGRRQHLQQKTAISNAIDLDIKDLPIDDKVSAVGKFENFALDTDSKSVKANEPITLTVNIEGEGNLDNIEAPKLDLPDSFKCYESKIEIDYDPTEKLRGKKSFSYVLQAKDAGLLEIPSQKFAYFDVKTRKVKTLETDPIKLDIKPNDVAMTFSDKVKKVASNIKNKYKKDINFIEEDGPIFTDGDDGVNIWVFFALILFPILLFAGHSVEAIYKYCSKKISLLLWPHKPLVEALKRLKKLRTDGKVESLHQFLISFISDRFGVSDSDINEDWIRKKLLKNHWSFDKIEGLLDYFHGVAGLSFSDIKESEIDKDKTFDDMITWIKLLDKVSNPEKT